VPIFSIVQNNSWIVGTFWLVEYDWLVCSHIEYPYVWIAFFVKYIYTAFENVPPTATKLIPGYKDLEHKEHLQRVRLATLSHRRLRGEPIEL